MLYHPFPKTLSFCIFFSEIQSNLRDDYIFRENRLRRKFKEWSLENYIVSFCKVRRLNFFKIIVQNLVFECLIKTLDIKTYIIFFWFLKINFWVSLVLYPIDWQKNMGYIWQGIWRVNHNPYPFILSWKDYNDRRMRKNEYVALTSCVQILFLLLTIILVFL